MGTSSSGSSGSGSGLRAGTRGSGTGGSSGSGGYVSSQGKVLSKSFKKVDIKNEVSMVLKQLFMRASPYVVEMFCNDYLLNVYSELFRLSQLARSGDPVRFISDRYNLNMNEPGFVLNLINKLDEKYRKTDIDSRCADAVRQTLEGFLFKALSDDYDLAVTGTGKEVSHVIKENTDFWKSISGYYLSTLAITMFSKEIERKTTKATFAINQELERRTNEVIVSYEKLSREGKTNYERLFTYICQNWEWFKTEMTK